MAPRDRWLARAMEAVLTPAERDQLAQAAPLMARLAAFESDVAPAET
jgi:hypothetical protein